MCGAMPPFLPCDWARSEPPILNEHVSNGMNITQLDGSALSVDGHFLSSEIHGCLLSYGDDLNVTSVVSSSSSVPFSGSHA